MGKKLAFWGDCNGYGYKIIRILEELGGINVSNYAGNEVILLYYIDKKNHIKGTYNGDLDKEKYVIMTYHDFISKYPFQVGDTVYSINTHEKGNVFEIAWDETKEQMRYLVDFESSIYWVSVNDIFCYEAKDNSECGTAIKPMKVKSNAVKLVDNKVVDNLENVNIMGKKLAIKGHSTRGKEVIELLEMMGGINPFTINDGAVIGNKETSYYYISEDNIASKYISWDYIGLVESDKYEIFTLEEFLEKYPFKVGDKVVYTKYGDNCDDYPVTIESMKWTGTTIEYTFDDCVTCLAKDLKMWKGKPDEVISGIYLNSCNYADEVELNLGDYDIEVRDGRTYAVKKKPKYPKTYEECCKITEDVADASLTCFACNLLNNFQKLLLCRDAYWEISGEQMGLGKPWEPKFGKTILFDITFYFYQDYFVIHKGEYVSSDNCILVFPTEEMRDTFYENFKDLIEKCKKFL